MAEQDFLKLLDQDSRALRDQDELDQAFTYGSRFNPDQYAEALRTGQRTGLPAPTALERSGDLQPTLAAEDFRKRDLPRTAPSTASFLKQPDNAALALDDLDSLTGIEKSLAERNRDYNRDTTLAERVGNRINEGWQGLKQSMVGMIYGESIRRGGDAGAGGDVQIGTDPLGMPIYTSQAYTPRQNQRVTQLQREVGVASNQALAEKSAPIQKARRAIEQRPATQAMIQAKSFREGFDAFMVDPLGVLADIGISSSVQQLPALAATVATRSPAVAVAAAGGNSYALEYGGGVLQYLGEQGIDTTNADAIKTALADPNTARDAVRYAEARGAIVGGFDAASGGLLTKTLVPAKAIKNETARKAVNLLVAQPVAQGAVGAAGEATAQVATTGEVQAGDVLAEALGEFSAAPIEAVSLATDKIGQVQRAKDNSALFDSLSEGAANSRLRKRMPEKFRQWFEGVTKGGPLESIYMPADRFTTYFQAKGIDPMDVATRLGVTNFDEAVASGGDIEISMAAFAEQIAGTEDYAGLADDIRLDPDEMTNREALAFEEQLPALMAELRGLQDGEVDTSRNADDPSNAIYDDVLGQLMGTGMERSAAERNATIVQKTIGTIASRMGIDPMKLWGKYNLGIDRPLPTGMKRGTVDTQLDQYLDALRTGKVPGDNDIFGKSLVQALIEAGGLQPSGELDAMDAKLARPGLISQSGKSLDDALMWAYENGYISAPTQALDRYDANAANTNDLLDLIDSELRGHRQYAMGRENTALMQFRDTVNQLGDWLRSMDIDLDGMDNEAIKALIRERAGAESAPADGMTTFDQEAGGTTPYTGATIDIDGVQRSTVNSNGQRIAQTQEGLRNFWAWFGDSYVTEAPTTSKQKRSELRPMVVYHGTRKNFDTFAPVREGNVTTMFGEEVAVVRHGIFFAENPEFAATFANQTGEGFSSTMPVYLSIQNPLFLEEGFTDEIIEELRQAGLPEEQVQRLRYRKPGMVWAEFDDEAGQALVAAAKAAGYDGAYMVEPGVGLEGEDDQLVWIAFDSTQIKSATGNRGTFDPNDPSILNQPAYHGSPFRFDKFSLDAIGTGEGAQAFGWGLYFASEREIAQHYTPRNEKAEEAMLAEYQKVERSGDYEVLELWEAALTHTPAADIRSGQQFDYIPAAKREKVAKAVDAIFKRNPGSQLYRVNIPDDDQYLLWDKPLSEQPEKVRALVEPLQAAAQKRANGRLVQDPTGYQFYEGLVSQKGGAKEASLFLRDLGIAGIKYQGSEGQGSFNYVVFDDQAVQIAETFYQRKKDADAPRGQIAFGPDRQFRISLFAGADLSTFLHEGGHFYLEVMRDVVAELGAADPASLTETQRGLLDDGDRIIKWLGVDSWDAIGVDQHEQFARGIEAYLMEGRAPSADLMPVFQRIKGWLIQIYRSLLALNVELTDDVRGVFDRLMATDAEIAAVRKAEAMSPLYSDADALRAAGATDAEIAAYQRTVQMDVAQAESEVTRKVMVHLKRQQQSWWREMRDTVRAEVVADLNNDPTYRAISTLSRGVLPDGSPLPDGFPAITLAKRPLLEKYGQAFLTERLLRLRVYRNDGGIDPDMAADMLGFGSGDELVEAIVNAPKYREAVRAETDRRLEALYPDPMLDGSVSEMALLAAHNEKRAEIIGREISLLERQAGRNGQKVSRQVMKATAERVISEKRVRDIKVGSYKAAEARASRAATRAFLKGDLATAAVEKRRQLLNHYLYRAATDALQAVEKQRDYLNKVAVGKSREAIVKGGREYIDRIDALLEAFDFGKVSLKSIDQQKVERARLLADMQAFAASKAEQGEVIEVDDQLLASPVANYKEMTPAQLQSLRDMVKNIATQARDAREFQAAEIKAAFDELATRTIGEIEDALPANRKGEVRGPVADKKRILSGYFLELRNLPSLIGELAGFKENSTLWNYIVRPLQQAAARENVMKQEANAKLRELFAPYKGQNLYGKGETIPGALIIRPLNKMQRLMIAASWGAETGRQRLLDIGIDGKGFSQAEVSAILATLDERDWAFVKGLWSYLDSYWGDVSAKMERLGLEPERVQPLPIETRFGTMPGGYFPIKYEGRLDNSTAARDEAQIATEMKQAAFTRSTTRNGHTKARLDRVVEKGGVRYDFGVIFQHVNEVIHDLTHHEPLRDVQKLLNHKVADADGRKRSLLDVIVRKKGDLYRDQIRQVLDEIAVGDLRAPEGAEVILRHVASGSSIAIMGYSVWSAVQNVTGLLQSAQLLRGWLVKGLADWAGSPASMARQIDEVYAKSEFMRLRHVTLNRDIAALQNNLQRGVVAGELGQVIGGDIGGAVAAKSAAGLDVLRDGAFWLMAKVQLLVDMPTWLGAYAKAQSENPGISEDNAVALADQAVIDAQGGGRTVDLSKMLRGDGWKRVWTTFAQYFNVTYMRTVAAMKQFGMEPSPTAAARLTVDLMFLWFLPVVATMMMKSAVQVMVGGEGDDWDEFWEKLPKEQASYLVNFFPLLREAAALFSGYSGYSGPAGAKVFAEFNKLGQQAAQGEIDKALVKSATMTTGILFHIPTLQLIRTGEGLDAYLNGDGTPMAVVFGPPRN